MLLVLAVPLGIRVFGCSEPQYLRVAAALSVAPVAQEAAAEFNDHADGCLYAQVTETPPHAVMTDLAGGRTLDSTVTPDVWIPESSAWVELARVSESGAQTLEPDPRSLASSPVVLAVPEDADGVAPADEHTASWDLLLPDARDPDRPVVLVDPNRGADGMAAMYAIRQSLGTGDQADAEMTEFVHDVQLDSAFGHIELSGVYPGADPLTVVPEQSVRDYNASGPPTRLRALHPEEGTVTLDYPFTLVTDDADRRSGAESLYELLSAQSYQDRLGELGFREPSGAEPRTPPDVPGVEPDPPETHEDLTGDALLTAIEDWNRLSMPSRALVLADVSDTAGEPLSGDLSRLDVAVEAAELGLALFPDQTDMGLWLLSTELDSSGHEETHQLARLEDSDEGQTVRERLRDTASAIELEGGDARLYDSIGAAYDEMTDAYHEDKINSVIVLTSGDDEGRSELSEEQLVAQLEDSFDPERPVTMFIIAFGDFEDERPLTEIANATSGTAYFTEDADEIGDIFLSSISRRLCVPDCDSREDSP
ncbi:VWA domain-containing protein [Spiractinospora alimapuensis]|nr:substrate-binding and VWA domain-containing protein [Spiractinospora alimapuensis]QVQ54771.1 VWA domain-containing protein [Spiractinospora alimapuensis]